MMVVKADFEKSFQGICQPSDTCIARWEDDGGCSSFIPPAGPSLHPNKMQSDADASAPGRHGGVRSQPVPA